MESKILLGLFATILFISCDNSDSIRASGSVTSREYTLTGYDGLEISGAFDVFVEFSSSFRITTNYLYTWYA